MSENPLTSTGLKKRKVFGIPVLYLTAGGVAVLAVYAWRMRPIASVSPSDDATPDSPTDVAPEGYLYPEPPTGTVVVAPPATNTLGTNSSIKNNEDWLKAGVSFLIKSGISAGAAQNALQAYLEGAQLTYIQGQMRDSVIGEYGMPPYPTRAGGTDAPIPPPTPVNTPTPVPPNVEIEKPRKRRHQHRHDDESDDEPDAPEPAPAPRTYTVVKGDSLSKIGNALGVPWRSIYEANRGVVGSNPNLIYPGQVLTIP